jgi:hypothetical protein
VDAPGQGVRAVRHRSVLSGGDRRRRRPRRRRRRRLRHSADGSGIRIRVCGQNPRIDLPPLGRCGSFFFSVLTAGAFEPTFFLQSEFRTALGTGKWMVR